MTYVYSYHLFFIVFCFVSGTRQSLETLRKHIQLPSTYPRSATALLMQKMSTQKLEMGKQNDSVDSIDKMVSRIYGKWKRK